MPTPRLSTAPGPTGGRLAPALLAALLVPGCGPSDADRQPAATTPPPAVRDSAGIRIVENAAPRWAEGDGWKVAPDPDAVLSGEGDPSFALFRVRGLALLPDGAIAAANAGSGQVAVLERDGRLRATLGRPGEGPGEFEWLNGILARGDTVVGIDGATLRLSLFGPDGSLARDLALDPEQGAPTGIRAVDLGDAGIGVFREVGFAEKMPEPGVVRLPGSAVVLRWDGTRTPELEGDFPGGAIYVAPDAMGTLPMGADLHLAGSEDGFFVGDGARPEVRVYGPDGALIRLIRWSHEAPVVDAPMQDRWREAELEGLRREMARGAGGEFGGKAGSPEAREELEAHYRRQFERIPFPDRLPAFAGLLVDATGHVWVRRYRLRSGAGGPTSWQGKGGDDAPSGAGTDWWIFAPDGAWLGTVTTPPGLEVMAVSEDAVWGVHRDALEVETVRRHLITR